MTTSRVFRLQLLHDSRVYHYVSDGRMLTAKIELRFILVITSFLTSCANLTTCVHVADGLSLVQHVRRKR